MRLYCGCTEHLLFAPTCAHTRRFRPRKSCDYDTRRFFDTFLALLAFALLARKALHALVLFAGARFCCFSTSGAAMITFLEAVEPQIPRDTSV